MPQRVLSGRTYEVIGPERCTTFDPRRLSLRVRAKKGDKRPEDGVKQVRRAGYDGWRHPFLNGVDIAFSFYMKLGAGWRATKLGYWGIPFEVHAKKAAIDTFEDAGPLGIGEVHSKGSGLPRFRIGINHPVIDPATGKLTAIRAGNTVGVDYYDAPSLTYGTETLIVVNMRFGADGYCRVWQGGAKRIDYAGPFGYGDREHYPCLRVYCNEREDELVEASFRVVSEG